MSTYKSGLTLVEMVVVLAISTSLTVLMVNVIRNIHHKHCK